MSYIAKFPTLSHQKIFHKALREIPQKKIREAVMTAIEHLENTPRPVGQNFFKTLSPPIEFYDHAAQYRIRIGDYRIRYDVDDQQKVIWILALRKRDEKTYRF